MFFRIDSDSNEAIYMQLYNQIIFCIATEQLKTGETLPSVRQLADAIGINMHTVNKTYALLREQGYIRLDRRHGAVVDVDMNHLMALQEIREPLKVIIARALCRNVSSEEIHLLIDNIIEEFGKD